MYIMLDSMYMTMYISTGLYPNLDLQNTNKLQFQLQLLRLVWQSAVLVCHFVELLSHISHRTKLGWNVSGKHCRAYASTHIFRFY